MKPKHQFKKMTIVAKPGGILVNLYRTNVRYI
jgi:hypothetical protein